MSGKVDGVLAWFLFSFLFSKKITEEYALLMYGKVDADGLSLK